MNWLKILKKKILSKQKITLSTFEKSCKTCKFKINDSCTVGTYYANIGLRKICYEGELWENKKNLI